MDVRGRAHGSLLRDPARPRRDPPARGSATDPPEPAPLARRLRTPVPRLAATPVYLFLRSWPEQPDATARGLARHPLYRRSCGGEPARAGRRALGVVPGCVDNLCSHLGLVPPAAPRRMGRSAAPL